MHPRPSRAKSCTACRQAKLACDARHKSAGVSCTRCSKRGLQCRIVEAITNCIDPQQPLGESRTAGTQSHTKQSTMSQEPCMSSSACTRSSSPSSRTDSQYSNAPIGTTQDNTASSVGGCTGGGEAWLQLKAVDIPSSYQLGSLNVNNTVALELFQQSVLIYPEGEFKLAREPN
ncbi:hypothetical protein FOTG_18243 [Fusarium oxysporum f. sp. vasinfectum 25433]|uniref:Zn(2)-C6 fungal-type domain-containing protein n=1 Tax=Fusarium oxysporum f. sp. vasinfectum 25433 TaxID=1089449 RepID=X0KIJ1_FUSOX|nr:hypothetical protein FOTG_18243 [Fusarium oxysporum f. sp. vasinfectum 25433]